MTISYLHVTTTADPVVCNTKTRPMMIFFPDK